MYKQVFLFLIICIIPAVLLANAGSPVVWFGVFHLFIANAAIGFWESSILEKKGFPNRLAIVIFANYVSMMVGYFLITPLVIHPRYGRDPDTTDVSIAFVLSFFATLLIEYPFFRLALRKKEQRSVVLGPFFQANITTNIVMLLIYLLFTG
ncbi:MAG: hypothetical protein EOO88_01090 [Pedobacter sp.]|nr:MAG: hypothetical protein EOO88_01090 [Pedobacter sp.]